jgi:DNA-binding CsgD family transcriptional regulator/PAS domain-containing protein
VLDESVERLWEERAMRVIRSFWSEPQSRASLDRRAHAAEASMLRLERQHLSDYGPVRPRGIDGDYDGAAATSQRHEVDPVREAVDRLPIGLVVVDASGRILSTNATAKAILVRADGLIQTNGRIGACQHLEAKSLLRCIDEIACGVGSAGRDGGTALRVTRRSGEAGYILLLSPLGEPRETAGVAGETRVLVLIEDLATAAPRIGDHLKCIFEFTAAEATVAAGLAEGRTPRDIAEKRGVRLSTVRTQLKAILAKTGVSRQADLVRLIARLPRVVSA